MDHTAWTAAARHQALKGPQVPLQDCSQGRITKNNPSASAARWAVPSVNPSILLGVT